MFLCIEMEEERDSSLPLHFEKSLPILHTLSEASQTLYRLLLKQSYPEKVRLLKALHEILINIGYKRLEFSKAEQKRLEEEASAVAAILSAPRTQFEAALISRRTSVQKILRITLSHA